MLGTSACCAYVSVEEALGKPKARELSSSSKRPVIQHNPHFH